MQVLAIGFLLVILSSALFHKYLTLLVVATYVLAPVPNWLCSKAQASDDFMDGGHSGIVELGRFITGFMVVMGIGVFDTISMYSTKLTEITALPVVLAHTEQIAYGAMAMSIVGGLLIYGTIISFTLFFREQEEF